MRSAILDVLHTSDEPMNGYQVIQQIADRTDGVWKPSPGSVYPTIAQLQDEGLVEDAPDRPQGAPAHGEGTAYVEGHAEEMAAVWAPFAEEDDDVEAVNFKQVVGQTVGAIVQVDVDRHARPAREGAWRSSATPGAGIYGLLAEGPQDTDEEPLEEE